jgi:UrcA family protein
MRIRTILVAATGVIAGAVASAVAQTTSDETPEVTVQSSRMVSSTIGRSSSGIPIVNVSLSYTVTAVGLDLSSLAGAREFEKRVAEAAMAACKEISQRYPDSSPDDRACARAATDKAMVKVHELEAAAAKKKS